MKQKSNPHYLIYKITNLLNNKIYIGLHKTYDINDDYMGSGKNIKNEIESLGIENFKKEILFDFDNQDDMIKKEAELVNEEFLKRNDVYNIVLGGNAGWNKDAIKFGKLGASVLHEKRKNNEEFNKFYLQRLNDRLNDPNLKIKQKINWYKHFEENGGIYSFSGKRHSEKTKRKMSETHKRNGYQKGEKNSQFGKRWVTNIELKESKRIQNEDKLPNGWLEGRVTNFDNFLEKYNDALTKKEKWHFIDYEKDIKENKIPRILKNKNKNKI